MGQIKQHQASLKFLVITQIVTMVLCLVAVISFPEPEEITAAVTVMEELGEGNSSGWQLFIGLSLFLGFLGLWGWSLWQLYHLNQNGFTKFLGAAVLGLLLNFVIGGSWQTAMVSFLNEVNMLTAGAIIYIGFFFSDAFDDFMKEFQTGESTELPTPEEASGESQ
ncbi:MAG TPA: hypothetical protein DIT97_10460 [Gimesia maris]|uniref:Uncharacterized protein n=1 Tax=Gimesia maris TaxID=122 RepID=A0A3D3R5K8_9PLAN|nr:hypothetical protein [Gimesia maris]|tara:strand:+ start:21215 stop:21709 length:495 start_codon:yes stop_codon:yes gene_type:complete